MWNIAYGLHLRTVLEKYTIDRRDLETECEVCAWPAYVGDEIFFEPKTGFVYCSGDCWRKDQPVLQDNKPYFDLA